MIHLGSSQSMLDRSLMVSRGGFAWWYVDLVDAEGSGLVLIWSFGLPFLPGYAASARRGQAPEAGQRPSLNLAVYRRGVLVFYQLQEWLAEDAVWEEGTERCRMGNSVLETRVEPLEEGLNRVLEIRLDCPIPGSTERLTGTLDVRGPACQHGQPVHPSGDHQWTPLATACLGTVSLRAGTEVVLETEGRAYHDRNGGERPMHDLGIEHWLWGRAPVGENERIYYVLWPESAASEAPPRVLGMDVAPSGHVTLREDLQARLQRGHRARYGMQWWEALELWDGEALWMRIEHASIVDNGPFYLRFFTKVSVDSEEPSIGIGEAVRPDRVDLALHRPFVAMRVDRVGRRNSMWLPFFAGPTATRWRRLVGQWGTRRLSAVP